MKRKLFTLLAAISLLLCVATIILWIGSHWMSGGAKADKFLAAKTDAKRAGWRYYVSYYVAGGNFCLQFDRQEYLGPADYWEKHWNNKPLLFGCQFILECERGETHTYDDSGETNFSVGTGAVIAPLWVQAILFAVLPSLRLIRLWRTPSPSPDAVHCPACGYDLRATPERCPECGRAAVGYGSQNKTRY